MAERSSAKLYFAGEKAFELVSTVFSHPLLGSPARAVRGKTSGAYAGCGTFQWSPAVQALALLMLRTSARGCPPELPQLFGGRGSPAASLDFALGKPPLWLFDMFGMASGGEALAKRLFLRTNPEQKQPGPTMVRVNRNHVKEIRIYLNGRLIEDDIMLESMADAIEAGWRKCCKKRPTTARNHGEQPSLLEILKREYRREALTALRFTDIFNRRRQRELVESIFAQPLFRKLVARDTPVISTVDSCLSGAERLGFGPEESILRKQLCEKPLRVATACGQTGAHLIFRYLKVVKGYSIEIDAYHPYAIDILHRLLNGSYKTPPDLCTMGVAPAGVLLGEKRSAGYRPLMLIPAMSHQLAAPRRQKHAALSEGHYLFLDCDPSNPRLYFEDLAAAGVVRRSRTTVEHADPHEIGDALAQGAEDARAILYFPFTALNYYTGRCSLLTHAEPVPNARACVLFAHEMFLRDTLRAKCLDIAIRDAWLELRQGGDVLDYLVEDLLHDEKYLQFLKRVSGIEDFSVAIDVETASAIFSAAGA